jgi:hypothetical protein
MEHFYQLIDRPAVGQLLGLTWPQFHRKYRWKDPQWPTAEDFLREFALDEENDLAAIPRILKTRTLRWTMLRSTPQFYFMVEMIDKAPEIKKRCPQFWCFEFGYCQTLSSRYPLFRKSTELNIRLVGRDLSRRSHRSESADR